MYNYLKVTAHSTPNQLLDGQEGYGGTFLKTAEMFLIVLHVQKENVNKPFMLFFVNSSANLKCSETLSDLYK